MPLVKRRIVRNRPYKTIAAILGVLLLLAVFFTEYSTSLSDDKIIAGVRICETDVGKMSRDEAHNAVSQRLEAAMGDRIINVTYNGKSRPIDLTGKVSFDVGAAVDSACALGHEGGFAKRLREVLGRKERILLEPEFDEGFVKSEILAFAEEIEKDNGVIEYDEDEKIVRVDLDDGIIADVDATYSEIFSNSKNMLFHDVDAVVKSGIAEITPGLLLSRINREPVNAAIEMIDNRPVVQRHKNGIVADEAAVKEKMQNGETVFELSVAVIPAEITAEKLQSSMFNDVLGEYTTYYGSNNIGRAKNISLAAGKINGVVIAPGQDFSFNRVVGERTYKNGYMDANVYVGGRIEQGVGGGICQVSSTLYSAQLYADLETVTRHNHMFTVSYLPLGQDATVSWNSIDYVFRNNTDYPIKITAAAGGGALTVRILGTKTDEQLKIKLINTTVSVQDTVERTELSNDVPPGQRVIKQVGQRGAVVDTYKAYIRNGVEEKRVFVHRSKYVPMERIIAISRMGTISNEPADTVEPAPVDGADGEAQPSTSPSPAQDSPAGEASAPGQVPEEYLSDDGL